MSEQIDVVVLGMSPTGLYAVREAASAGYRVLGVGNAAAPSRWSRKLSDYICAETPAARIDAIVHRFRCGQDAKPVLVVCSDQDLEAVFARAETLSEHVHLQSSYIDGLADQIMDKSSFYKLCDKHNVAYPKLLATSREQVSEYKDRISYPCMIKPARIQAIKHLMGGRKGWIIKTRSEFDSAIIQIPQNSGTLLLQEIVPGPESNITLWCGYLDNSSQVRQRFTARKLRQYPPGFGSASLVQSETCKATAQLAERLITELGYRGIAAAEFKWHRDNGQLYIIEINPRPSLWFSLSTASGIRLVEMAVAEALGSTMPPIVVQRDGVRWRYALKDITSAVFYARNKDFVLPPPEVERRSKVRQAASVVFAWDDPWPALGDLWSFFVKGTARLIRKLGARK